MATVYLADDLPGFVQIAHSPRIMPSHTREA